MKKILFFVFISFCIINCKESKEKSGKNFSSVNTLSIKDTTPKITGIGGIFFLSNNVEETKDWYKKNLGLITDDYGAVFEFRNSINKEDINYLRWSLIKNGDSTLYPSKKSFMINYRVQNIEAIVKNLKQRGVRLLDDITVYEYGKFVHFLDIEGNKIELWEPVDSVLTKWGGVTNK